MATINDFDPQAAAPAAAPAPAPAAEPAPVGPQEPNINALPPEVANLPVVQAVAIGQPPAVIATKEADGDSETAALIGRAARDLPAAGLALYADEDFGVLFNPAVVPPQEIAQAVKDGTIDQIAVPLGMLEETIAEVMAEQNGGVAPASGPGVPPAPSSTRRQINSARLQNTQPQAPTAGAKPGQGIINDLSRPVI